jgi:predicted GIY-YIG superfamily endonuclease
MTGTWGTVYLIHFDRPYKHARHYTGWTKGSLDKRLQLHRQGQGSRLMAVVTAAGIGWQLARTWEGGRRRERQIKAQGGASRCCPLCGVRPRTPAAAGATMPAAAGTPAEPARPAARSAGMTAATAGRRGTPAAPSCRATGGARCLAAAPPPLALACENITGGTA